MAVKTTPNAAVLGENEYGMPRQMTWTARFAPKNLDTLRPGLHSLIGEITEWRYAGRGMDDEPYPGQWRWMPTADDGRWQGRWVPDEDLEPVYPES